MIRFLQPDLPLNLLLLFNHSLVALCSHILLLLKLTSKTGILVVRIIAVRRAILITTPPSLWLLLFLLEC